MTGASQATGLGSAKAPEPHSRLRPAGAIPRAGELAEQLLALIARATDNDLDDGGRYFNETFCDLTQCSHGDTGEYSNSHDGRLIEFLWNTRYLLVDALRAAARGEQP